eukprot:CAMPEP_0168233138 /NCGR_PEP_ID=MMETSP0140_2-20121125/17560_1 /TAXON_ID=44445 /ORGANISM="Pseudo-nitzschia australis, Strain 10249 10 AB" /LENGTH=637 /DNA_ID=CAMNT_0008165819 /DNA_START=427 /DNA_END=2340 /DNA_ORIENTATION=+
MATAMATATAEPSMPASTNNAPTETTSSDAVQSRDPIFFPPNDGEVNHDDERNLQTFAEACRFAADCHRPLHLLEDVKNLPETIVLRKRQFLTIRGIMPLPVPSSQGPLSSSPSPSSSSPSSQSPPCRKKIRISGNTHSLFLLNNHSRLRLLDLELVHEEDTEGEDSDCRKVGAAVNLRYKSNARIEDCSVTSRVGFCCWAVQKASIDLDRSYLEAPLRSALVCFGRATLKGRSSTIANAGVHGVCARGECLVRLIDCSVVESAVRGLYAYANACVCLEGCTIRGTVRPDMAAIEVSSAVPTRSVAIDPKNDSNSNSTSNSTNSASGKKGHNAVPKTSSLIMKKCRVTENAGVGVRIRGGVRYDIPLENEDNETLDCEKRNCFDRNSGGNQIDVRPATGENDATTNHAGTKGIDDDNDKVCKNGSNAQNSSASETAPKRDASGSSFRKGDWWCPLCSPRRVVQGSKDACPCCEGEKRDGTFLSTDEVIKLNRGIFCVSSIKTTTVASVGASATSEILPSERNIEHKKSAGTTPTWWFDGDDAGWLPYDSESSQKLESAFQSNLCLDGNGTGTVSKTVSEEVTVSRDVCPELRNSGSPIVLLSDGKYRVDLETMEQTNTDSHFLRLVQRRKENSNTKN